MWDNRLAYLLRQFCRWQFQFNFVELKSLYFSFFQGIQSAISQYGQAWLYPTSHFPWTSKVAQVDSGKVLIYFFHTQLWFLVSELFFFRQFKIDFQCFWKVITGKNTVEEVESIMGFHTKLSSPSWVCIPQKSITIARDFWNTNSLGWTQICMGAHDGFSIFYISRANKMCRKCRATQ